MSRNLFSQVLEKGFKSRVKNISVLLSINVPLSSEAMVETVAKNTVPSFKFKVKWDSMEHAESKTTNGTMYLSAIVSYDFASDHLISFRSWMVFFSQHAAG